MGNTPSLEIRGNEVDSEAEQKQSEKDNDEFYGGIAKEKATVSILTTLPSSSAHAAPPKLSLLTKSAGTLSPFSLQP